MQFQEISRNDYILTTQVGTGTFPHKKTGFSLDDFKKTCFKA